MRYQATGVNVSYICVREPFKARTDFNYTLENDCSPRLHILRWKQRLGICDILQIYGRGPRGPPSQPELVEQLVAMGFDRNQSVAALRRFRNMDMALVYLLRAAEEDAANAQQQQAAEGGGAVEEAVAAAAGSGPQLPSDQAAQFAAAGAAALETGGGVAEAAQGTIRMAPRRGQRSEDGESMIELPGLASSDDEEGSSYMLAGGGGSGFNGAGMSGTRAREYPSVTHHQRTITFQSVIVLSRCRHPWALAGLSLLNLKSVSCVDARIMRSLQSCCCGRRLPGQPTGWRG